jgi:Response regulators consisting of a CheY-like receiver domain and a winged-helix DNA-binding domain
MVIDRRLPGVSGTELIGQVRTAGKTTPILLLTALGTVDDKVYGLDSGANDYLVKPFDFAELLARLRSLVRAFTITHKGRYIGEWLFTPDQNLLFSPFDQRITLTAQENRLLELLSSAPDHVFSREEILSAAFPGGESKAAVETYVHYVRAKATPGIIETIRGRGYRLGDQP